MRTISFRKTLLATSIALTLGTAHVEAALVTNVLGTNTTYSTDSANFTMLAANGGVVGGTNNVEIVWGGGAYDASSDYTGPGTVSGYSVGCCGPNYGKWVQNNPDGIVTLNSTAPFFGHSWTAHEIQMFLPGSYSFDVTLGGGNPETGMLNMTVGAGQLGLHMLWDWGGDNNIDVAMVFDVNSAFGSGLLYSSSQVGTGWKITCDSGYTGTITKNCIYDGWPYGSAGAPTKNQVWMLASADGNGDGVMGIPMAAQGPFAGFNWNFSAFAPTAVPIPAAVWLFGSGLIGLVGAARRRRQGA